MIDEIEAKLKKHKERISSRSNIYVAIMLANDYINHVTHLLDLVKRQKEAIDKHNKIFVGTMYEVIDRLRVYSTKYGEA